MFYSTAITTEMTMIDVQGAKMIGQYLVNKYGEQSFAMVVDEGGEIRDEGLGSPFAYIGTAEKGYLDVHASVSAPGGHSSVPPLHTVRLAFTFSRSLFNVI